jgi:chaperone required for assembly of F1-ATPase
MTGWAAKRFWKEAQVDACEGGFTVTLDGRAVKTPAKALLVVPTRAMAEAISAEWDAQQGKIDPGTMPVTRAANSAIDKVTVQYDEVVGLLADYGGSDLLCYRAIGPAELIARQEAGWNPVLDWAATALEAPLRVTQGVVHVAQDPRSLARLRARVAALDAFELTAFHDLVAISGSLVLALAVIDGRLSADEAWVLSRIDETWQTELWGHDEEADRAEAVRHEGFLQADRFYRLCH